MNAPKLEIFDNSMLQCYKDCPRKFYWRYARHLVPLVSSNYITAFGSAGHDALAEWYESGDSARMDKAFIDYFLPYEGQDPTGKRSIVRGLMICKQYREQYATEPFDLIGKEYIEVGFVAELGKHLICGKCDMLIRWSLLVDGIVAMEHKFSSSKGYLICEPNDQLDTYIWGVSKLIAEPVVGAYLNICYHTAKDITKNEFHRELTYRTPEQLLEWEFNTKYYFDLIDNSCEKGIWPKNTKHCGAFWRECEYTRLCKESCRDEQEALVPVMYHEERWDPYPEARTVETIKEK